MLVTLPVNCVNLGAQITEHLCQQHRIGTTVQLIELNVDAAKRSNRG